MHQSHGIIDPFFVMIDRVQWTMKLLDQVYDELEEMEHQCYHLKNELSVAVRTLRSLSRRTLHDFDRD